LSDGAVPVKPAAFKEAVMHHALAKQKKDDRQEDYKQELSLIPNEGGFRPAGPVVFNELAIDLILTTSANLGAARQGQTLA
jgi:hypothetical protein